MSDKTGKIVRNKKRKNYDSVKVEVMPIDNIMGREVNAIEDNKDTPIRELLKHGNNLKVVLENSNATPIRYHIGGGYVCCFCMNQYPDPADLKKHTLISHDEGDRVNFMKKQAPNAYILKLDITSLQCKLCDSNIETLQQLFDHLQSIHEKIIYDDIKNQMVPFKFDGDQLKCVICCLVFGKFKGLQEHMNTHYRNYVCDICDAGCINRKILTRHMITHKTGSFKCDECCKVFNTFQKKRLHENSVHMNMTLRSKCRYCKERFKSNQMRDQHMTKEHGVPPVIRQCLACDRSFTSQNALRIHNKRDHLMERQYRCMECSKSFYNRFQLQHHMLKHSGKKDFQCNVCLKAFARMYTLREHMRIHADDRRFKCVHCGRAFVQKCSLRGHMRAIHGEIDICGHQYNVKNEIIGNTRKIHNAKVKVKKLVISKENKTSVVKVPDSVKAKKIENNAPIQEHRKHSNNFEVVLANSTATPIRSHNGIGYTCCFCSDQYVNPAELKSHAISTHDNSYDRREFMKKQTSSAYLLKLDITLLKCKICDESVDTLESLFDHLQNEHKKLIYTDVKNQIIPFKFTSEELKCAICPLVFNRFKILLEHMHTHYRNYICDVCDVGCINRRVLLTHKGTHKIGNFECNKCNKIFATQQRRTTHVNTVHKYMNKAHKCAVCHERFKSSQMKDQHMTNKHGMTPVIRKCLACEKTFTSQNSLRLHRKKFHLMERQYQCTECEMNFFTGAQLKYHMLKHTGRKDFQCDVCLKWFGRKCVLREHMRIHTNDRRFKCLQCGRGFVQKCSLRGHMRAIHGEIDDRTMPIM